MLQTWKLVLSKTTASHTQRCALGEGMLQTSLFQLQDAVSWAPTLRKEIQKLDATQQSSSREDSLKHRNLRPSLKV